MLRGDKMSEQIIKHIPRRLDSVFYSQPLYFVTFNTWKRVEILANQAVFNAFVAYAEKNVAGGRAIGRFVIMPDHIHLFVRIGQNNKLSDFIRMLRQSLTKVIRYDIGYVGTVWQPGFFDHLLRSSDSYSEKWMYVRDNPVRKKLVQMSEDWSWQGEIVCIDRV